MSTMLLGEGVGLGQQANLQILDIDESLSKQRWIGESKNNASSWLLEAFFRNLVTRQP